MANFQLQDTQKVPYAVFESDADGNIGTPGTGDSVSVTTDSPTSLSISSDATVDPAKVPAGANASQCLQTGFIVGGSVNKVGCQVTATFSHADGTPAPAAVVDLIDNIVGPLTTGALSLGAPVSQ